MLAEVFYAGTGIEFQSDKRIKKDIQEINDDEALITFRRLKPCKYGYKETLLSGRTTECVYGYIAQEVAEILPHAVKIGALKGSDDQGLIPNIMTLCTITTDTIDHSTYNNMNDQQKIGYVSNNENGFIRITVTMVSSLDTNGLLKNINVFEKNRDGEYHPLMFYDNKKEIYESNIIHTVDETTFFVDELFVEQENMITEHKFILLYGQKPNDFHRLNKDVIYTITAAALQEVDRQQQNDKERIKNLEAQIEKITTDISLIRNHIGM